MGLCSLLPETDDEEITLCTRFTSISAEQVRLGLEYAEQNL